MSPSGRQLALSKADNFFSDPAFADILSIDDAGLKNKLDLFKQSRALALVGGGQEAAHNLQVFYSLIMTNHNFCAFMKKISSIQVTASNDKFLIQLELPGFAPEEFSLKTRDDVIVLEANHQGKTQGGDEETSR